MNKINRHGLSMLFASVLLMLLYTGGTSHNLAIMWMSIGTCIAGTLLMTVD